MLVRNEKKRDYVVVLIAGGLMLIAASGLAAQRLAAVDKMVGETRERYVALGLQVKDSAAVLDVYKAGYGGTAEGERLLQAAASSREKLKSLQRSCRNLVDTVEEIGMVERLLIYGNIKAAFDFFASETAAQQTQFTSVVDTSGEWAGSMPPIRLGAVEQQLANAE
jgi:hypothetical protein